MSYGCKIKGCQTEGPFTWEPSKKANVFEWEGKGSSERFEIKLEIHEM